MSEVDCWADPLWAALERSITALREHPLILFTKTPDYAEGLNAAEINRLAGRPVIATASESDQGIELVRWVTVWHPKAADPVRWRVWDRYLGHEHPTQAKLDRTIDHLRAWQMERQESLLLADAAGASRDQVGAGQAAVNLTKCLSAPKKHRLEYPPLRPGTLGQYDALYALWQAYLHMAAWGTEHYEDLDQEDREQFVKFLKAGALFEYVEDCKRHAIKSGLSVPDDWLNILCAGSLTNAGPLPEAKRDGLLRVTTAMYPLLVRLDPTIQEPDRQGEAGQPEGEGTSRDQNRAKKGEGGEPLADAYAALRQVAREKLKGQERAVIDALCDAGGELPIADLAVKEGIGWDDSFRGFRNVQQRLNPKLKPLGWTLARQNNSAVLKPKK